MKKIIASTVLVSSLFGTLPHESHAVANEKSCTAPSYGQVKPFDFKQPAVMSQLKKGTFQYHGLKLGDSMKKVEQVLGQSPVERIAQQPLGIISENVYGPMSFYGFSKHRDDDKSKQIFDGATYKLPKNVVIYKQDIKGLGKADETEQRDNKERTEKYGHLTLHYNKSAKGWQVEDVTYDDEKYETYNMHATSHLTKINKEPMKKLSAKQLKDAKAGKLSYYDIQKGMTPAVVKKKIGDSLQTDYVRTNSKEKLTQYYKDFYAVQLEYKAECHQQLLLNRMKLDYTFFGVKISDVEKTLGRPDQSVKTYETFDGERIDKIKNTYGHLKVTAEKGKKDKNYIVMSVIYQ